MENANGFDVACSAEGGRDPLERARNPVPRPPRALRPAFSARARPVEEEDRMEADELLLLVADGDQRAFEELYGLVSGPVFGLVRRVVRDPAQSEEVAREVLLELRRRAPRFDPRRGSALSWILTVAHRRAVDRVRSARAAGERERREARRARRPAFDQVLEEAEAGLEREWVRRCLDRLTALRRQSVTLAYYDGYTYREVAGRLSLPLGTVKTRMRDGLGRLRDCLEDAA
ncbi:ECF RNA polymerase sigma factor SigK [Streptomyces sp. NPDC000351]|uniref:ECF RNA polymerase sigma factor SigK n=1 Tax=Streptomyces sp. NPDC000351 TaxID=3154250 RepID=UPI00331A27BD